jgi:hypothetical protein
MFEKQKAPGKTKGLGWRLHGRRNYFRLMAAIISACGPDCQAFFRSILSYQIKITRTGKVCWPLSAVSTGLVTAAAT